MSLRPRRRIAPALGAAILIAAILIPAGPAAHAAKPRCFGKRATIVARPGQKVVRGTNKADVIAGTNGNQTIRGKGGRDRICGFGGKDRIRGQGGTDDLDGGGGNDNVNGGAGPEDLVAGNVGDDTLNGGRGDVDFLFGLGGNDALTGGGGQFDTAAYSESEAGVTVNLAAGTATGEGTDTLTGVGDIIGSQFNDFLTGNEIAEGNGFLALGGDDAIDGGGGPLDIVFFSEAASPLAPLDLTAGTVTGEGNDTLVDIEDAEGTLGDDVMIGSAAVNLLVGLDGSDQISGLAGDDVLFGDAGETSLPGSDTIDGGDGNDFCIGAETLAACEQTTPPSGRVRSFIRVRGHLRG